MKNKKIQKMVTVALLMALVVILQFISAALPAIGGFSISLVLLPIVIGAAVYGPNVGALLGGVFGMIVFINCVTGIDVGGAMVFQAGPLMCFVVVMGKGILAGLGAGLVYKLTARYNPYVAMCLSAIVCPVLNTGIFLLFMATVFRDVLNVWAEGGEIFTYMLSGIVLANFVPELIINVVFSPAGKRICDVIKRAER